MTMTRTLIGLAALAPALVAQAPQADNPFFQDWKTPFGMPPFGQIQEAHYMPAIREGIARQKAEVKAIVESQGQPTFANTVEALERSGEFLNRVLSVFGNLSGAETTPGLQAIRRESAPLLSAHGDDINLDPRLWARVKAVWEGRSAAKLNPEQARLLEKTYKGFVRAGAALDEAKQAKMRTLNGELSRLGVDYGDRLLKATKDFRLVLEASDLAGLPEGERAAAALAAEKAGQKGRFLFTLDGPSLWPFLQYAENRDLRKRMLTAYLERCNDGGPLDTKAIAARIATLRVEKANLLGYKTWADYVLEETMAKTPKGVYGLLDQLWKPTLAKATEEAAELQALLEKDFPGEKLQSWDWHFYAEKVKRAKYSLDEGEIKPYFPIDRVREGAFGVATKLYGITFTPRTDIPVYHTEVKAFEVKEKNGQPVGVMLVDYHPRPGKRGGAWCSAYRGARKDEQGKRIDPLVVNVCNFTRPTGDTPALLTADEVQTLFHEFGHALHNLFYQGAYRGTAGTPRDFVELPSQIMENWAMEPQVLKQYAKHWKTGEVIPQALIAKIQAASRYGQGFATGEYLQASFLDMDWHTLATTEPQDAAAFEQASLKKMGALDAIPPRYRTPYFNHIWGGGYASGYYAYIWSAVLDTDAFQAFKEKGNLFHPATAQAFRKEVLSRGGLADGDVLYRAFRGRDPKVGPLLDKRGLK